MQIPKEASAVAVINTKSLFTKIALDQLGSISVESIFGSSDANRPPVDPNSDEAKWRDLMSDPSQLGVDILADAYLLLGEVKNGKPAYAAAMMHLSDAAKMETYLNGNPPQGLQSETKKGEGFSYRYLEKEHAILSWNDKIAVMLFSMDKKAPLLEDVARIYNLPSNHAIAENASFEDFMKESRDVGLFINVQNWLSGTPAYQLPSSLAQLPIDNMGMQLDFDDGVASIRMKSYLAKQQQQQYEEMLEGVRLTETLQLFDMQEALGFANIRYTEAMIKETVENNPILKMQLAPMLMGAGLSEEEFYGLFKGGLMLACTGVGVMKQEVTAYEMDEEFNMVEKTEVKEVPAPILIIALETDVIRMKKMLNELSKSLMVTADGDGFKVTYPGFEDNGWKISFQDDKCLITNQPNDLSASYNSSSALAVMANASPMSFYLNIDQMVQSFPLEFGHGGAALRESISHIQMIINAQDKGTIGTEFELHLQNTDRNALLSLIDIFKKVKKENYL